MIRAMILVVEDEPGIVDFVERGLRRQGFEVTRRATARRSGTCAGARRRARRARPDAAPAWAAWRCCAACTRCASELPVIVLTARGEVEDRIAGLDSGAVDYLRQALLGRGAGRPDPRAVALRVTRHARRSGPRRLHIDLVCHARCCVDGKPVRLSTTEFELLVYLAQQPPARALARGDPAGRLGLQPRSRHQRRGGLHRLPAAEAAHPERPRSDHHGQIGRVPLRRGGALNVAIASPRTRLRCGFTVCVRG